jgi:hypothetical protein
MERLLVQLHLPVRQHLINAWEIELLSHMAMPTDPFSISKDLSQSVWMKQMGAFGWKISHNLGEGAAEGMGPAQGAKPTSYCFKACGMLAMLCFLQRLAEFTYQHEPWPGAIATDSLSFIDTIRGVYRSKHGIAYEDIQSEGLPLETLNLEWDIVIDIRRLIAAMPNLQLQHVCGHQDRRVEYHQLNLMAQLNVDADAMANRFQREYGAVRPHATLAEEGAGVHFVTPEGSITLNYASAIHYQATHKSLLQHIRERNGWTATIVDRNN